MSGKGEIIVNGKPAKEYFTNVVTAAHYTSPFMAVDRENKYDVSAKVFGGGQTGQLDALVLGVSRALVKLDEKYKTLLRGQGLLTRDPRKRQRRMVGMGGKARRKKQSPKR